MKYGLRKHQNIFKEPKKKWRKDMEDVIKSLEFEMIILKRQLQEATDKIKQLEPKQSKINIFFTEEPESVQINTRRDTRRVRYHETPEDDRDSFSQLVCITAMPEYQNQSLEELRMADYSIAGPQEHRQFIDFGLNKSVYVFTGTEFTKYKETWGVDPMTWIPFRYHSITVLPEYMNKSFEELRLEDYILKAVFSKKKRYKGLRIAKQQKQQKEALNNNSGFFDSSGNKECSDISGPVRSEPGILWSSFEKHENIFNSYDKSEHINYFTQSSKSEELFSQMLSSLNKLETHLSDVNSRLSSMDSRFSDLKTQISLMDSRLSAVDMFVTMERVNKKWKDLEPQLSNLGTLIQKNIKSSSDTFANLQVNNDSSLVTQSTTECSFTTESAVPSEHETESFCESKSSNIIKSSNSIKNHPCSLVLNILGDSLKKTDTKLVSSDNQLSQHVVIPESNLEKSFSNENKIENDLVINSLTKISIEEENCPISSEQNSESDISPNKNNLQNSFCNMDNILEQTSKEILASSTNKNSSLKTKERNKSIDMTNQLGVEIEGQTLRDDGNTSDGTNNDYVIVEKKDVDESDQYLGEEEQCKFGSDSSKNIQNTNIKICTNKTESLEENLGKKKYAVCKFGFEVTPDISGTDSLLETSYKGDNDSNKYANKTNASFNSPREDSFFKFMSQLTENHQYDHSSPVVIQHYKKKHLNQSTKHPQ